MGLTSSRVARTMRGPRLSLLAVGLVVAVLGTSGGEPYARATVVLPSDHLLGGRVAVEAPIGDLANVREGPPTVDPFSAGSSHPGRWQADAEAPPRVTPAPDRPHGTHATERAIITASAGSGVPAPFLSETTDEASRRSASSVEAPSVLVAAAAPTQEPPVTPMIPGVAAPSAAVGAPEPVVLTPLALGARATGLFRAMNEARATHGLGPFSLAADLTFVAHSRSADMSASGYFAHVSPTGESWLSLLAATGTRVLGGGENLARVSGDEANSVAIAIAHLMDSATHRANILNTRFDEVGVAAMTDADGVTVFTTIFATR